MNNQVAQLLAINIGNSRINLGSFANSVLTKSWYHPTSNPELVLQDISSLPTSTKIVICSVVPKISQIFKDALDKNGHSYTEISSQNTNILSNTYDSLGADRLANAVAGWKLYGQNHENIIILDIGTANTLTAVSREGRFLGGYITLGLASSLNALHEHTAQLPQFTDSELLKNHGLFQLGINTEQAIKHGTFLAHVGLIEYWVKMAKKELKANCLTVATGGLSRQIFQLTGHIDICDPTLTLKGIFLCGQAKAQADRD